MAHHGAPRDRTAWLAGGLAECRQPPPRVARIWRLLLLGAPGAGKGTQGALLANALGACPLSTGDVFRAASDRDAEPGSALATAQARMRRGELVSDPIVLDVIRERSRCLHCSGGFLLDGFPRTLPQAEALDTLLAAEKLQLDAVLFYDIDAELLRARLTARRSCRRCHSVFHLQAKPPKTEGICDFCAGELEQRADDQPEAITIRLDAYARATRPLLEHYRRRGLLLTIRADDAPLAVFAHTLDALAALPAASPR